MFLKTEAISEAAFKSFGTVLAVPERKPDATGTVHEYWDQLVLLHGETSVNYLITKPRACHLVEMERHVGTAEILVLLEGACLLPVAPAGDLNAAALRVFAMKPGDAVCLNPGTWHLLPFPVEKDSRFLVVYKNGTPQVDLEFTKLPEEAHIVVA